MNPNVRAIFIDRDGTLIRDMVYLNDPEKVFFFQDTFDALKRLKQNGYRIILVTNQSGVARGLVQLENLEKIHDRMQTLLSEAGCPLDDLYFCPHGVDDGCHCRKPKPGLILKAAETHSIDLSNSWMIGDRKSDIQAGVAAGCRSVLLQRPEENPETEQQQATFHCPDLAVAADKILKELN